MAMTTACQNSSTNDGYSAAFALCQRSSDSDSDSDADSDCGWSTRALEQFTQRERTRPATALGLPQSRSQSSFLSNLWKLLLDASDLNGVEDWIQWTVMETSSGATRTGYVVHWDVVLKRWDDDVLATLVQYRLFRRTNRASCAVASWARKTREWSFTIEKVLGADGTPSNSCFYYTDPARCTTFEFRPTTHFSSFPIARCRRTQARDEVVTQSSAEC